MKNKEPSPVPQKFPISLHLLMPGWCKSFFGLLLAQAIPITIIVSLGLYYVTLYVTYNNP